MSTAVSQEFVEFKDKTLEIIRSRMFDRGFIPDYVDETLEELNELMVFSYRLGEKHAGSD